MSEPSGSGAGASRHEQERVRSSGREIRHLYLAELRGAFRERNVVINTVLVPVLLYPLMLWLLINGFMFVQGQTERLVSRVEVARLPSEHVELLERIAQNEKIEIETATAGTARREWRGRELESPSGELDAALEVEARGEPAGDFRAVVTENSARESSADGRVAAAPSGARLPRRLAARPRGVAGRSRPSGRASASSAPTSPARRRWAP